MTLYVAVSGLYLGADAFTLHQLAIQDDLDFTVVFLDPGLDLGVTGRLDDFSARTGVRAIRIPYRTPPGGRAFDWAQWNTPFLLAESEDDRVLRLQSWRVAARNLVSSIKRADANVGFVRSVTTDPTGAAGGDGGVSWRVDPLGQRGAYGDWCLRVGDYLEVNGIDEPATMLFHFEDMDFEIRWAVAARRGLVRNSMMVSGLIWYLGPTGRPAAAAVDVGKHSTASRFRPRCRRCRDQWPELTVSNDPNTDLADLADRGDAEDLGVVHGKRWIHCTRCDSMVFHVGTPHFAVSHQGVEHRATARLLGRFGRDLRAARAKCLALHPDARPAYAAESYWDPDVVGVRPDVTAGSTMMVLGDDR